MTRFRYLVLAGSVFFATSSAMAHHSTRGIYDEEHEIELHATVKEWRFINPHPFLTIEAVGSDGKMHEWDVSYGGSAVVHLKRQGYSENTFKPGDKIIVKGNPARAEGVYGVLIEGNRHPTKADGSPLVAGGSPFGQ
ncbi:MAG: hypothetical protein H6978_03955 [Gammaproteobacteria bacterium]|nr:hypothetical protein [Gammaproteobacteria bacterium]